MLATGILTAASFVVIAAKIPRDLLKKILGYELWLDIASHTFFVGLGAISATYSGVLMGIISALCVSGVMRLARKVLGYSKFENGQWKDYPGEWSIATVTRKLYLAVVDGTRIVYEQMSEGITAAQSGNKLAA